MAPPVVKRIKISNKERVTRACDVCRRRKVKCDGEQPCSTCMTAGTTCVFNGVAFPKSKSLYRRDNELYRELRMLHRSAKSLSRNERVTKSGKLRNTLEEIERKISELQSDINLSVDEESVREYDGQGSLERQLVEINSICFNRFGSVDLKKLGGANVTPYFGIHSTMAIFSKYGFSWMFKRLIAYSNNNSTRETMYIYMKFLDMAQMHYAEDIKQKTTPIEWCFAKYSKGRRCKTLESYLRDLHLDIDRMGAPDILSRDLYEELALRPIEFFAKLVDFAWLNCYRYHSGLGDKFAITTELFEFEDILTCLVLEFSSKVIYADMHHEIIIPTLLRWVRMSHWHEELYTVGKMLACAVRRALDLGLNSWEYYISLSEENAERNRLIWWESYWWDKWFALSSGKAPLICDYKITCLLPRRLMEAGLDESMSCMEMLTKCNSSYLNETDIRVLGYILLGKYVEYINCEILYNKEFNDYRLFATVKKPIDTMLEKFCKAYRESIEIINNMELFLKSLTHINYGNDELLEFLVYFSDTRIRCFIALESMIFRMKALEISSSGELEKCLEISYKSIYSCSVDGLKMAVEFSSFFVGRFLTYINLMCLNLMLSVIENPENEPIENIIVVCRIVSLLKRSGPVGDLPDDTNIPISELICRQVVSLTYLCCRIYAQISAKRNRHFSEEHIINHLRSVDEYLVVIYEELNEITSLIFRPLLEVSVSGSYQEHLIAHFKETMGEKLLQRMKQLESEVQSSSSPSGSEKISTTFSPESTKNPTDKELANVISNPTTEPEITFETLLNSDSFASVYTDFLDGLDFRKPLNNDPFSINGGVLDNNNDDNECIGINNRNINS
ncbi:hypothetical protein RNJ44_00337 [Nakaseomyces bracarensis]|uniref:Zn(2)-C6 fungal-type domain-containing protein n=1 Tax=Nakaseomyces bracarensis TaxID=273131 RepID=A0ABR4NTJ9_9SACH